jgi:hypothetical protein
MPSGVGEDTYLFYKILKAGHRLVYEPSAYVWHRHRRDMRALRRQMYGYSKGHVAYLLTTALRDGDRRGLVRMATVFPGWHVRQVLRWVKWRLLRRNAYPLSLVAVEMLGHIVGPFTLWQSRRRVARQGRSGPYVAPARRVASQAAHPPLGAVPMPSRTVRQVPEHDAQGQASRPLDPVMRRT